MFSERRYLNKEFAEHAKAQDAALENDAEQYFRHQAKAERQAERADRAHTKHLAKEDKILKKEALSHRMAQESLARGDAAGFAHHEYRAARYHNRAGRTNAHRHYPAPAGHSHHHNPLYRGDIPAPGIAHEEVPIGAYGGVPPLGTAPIGGTMPVAPGPTASLIPPAPVPPVPMMGRIGGYTEEIYESPSPYYAAPPSGRRSMPPQTVRDFDVLDWERDFIPTNRPLGVAPEFRRVLPNAGYW